MSDPSAAAFACILLLVGAVAYARRERLQPNRAAAVAYLAGTVTWGLALGALWVAWATGAPESSFCDDGACESVVESIEETAAEFEDGFFLTPELIESHSRLEP